MLAEPQAWEEFQWELGSVADIRAELNRLHAEAIGEQMVRARTSVMTQVAWVPPEWREAALDAFRGLDDVHPSRLVLLFPEPDASGADLVGAVSLHSFERAGKRLFTEVIAVTLRGETCGRVSSVVLPLVRSDLPVFLRWRGELVTRPDELESLVPLADRLIVDSREWADPKATTTQLTEVLDRAVVSDITWQRTEPWRRAVAGLWPAVAVSDQLRVRGPRADALLLAGWFGSRLGRDVSVDHEHATEIEAVAATPHGAEPPDAHGLSASEFLSHQLEIVARDPIYEEAVCALSRVTTS